MTLLFTRFCAAAAAFLELELNTEQLIGLYNEIIASAKITGDTSTELRSYYQRAILYAREGIKLAKKTGNQRAEMNAYLAFGDAYNSLQQYDDAILHSKKCIDIAKKTGDQPAEMNAYLVLRDAYNSLQQYDDAILYIKKYIDIAKKTGDQRAEMNAYLLLEDAYNSLQQYDDAILYYKKCIDIAKEIGDQHAEITSYLILIPAYISMTDLENALRFAKEGLKTAEKYGNDDAITGLTCLFIFINRSLNMDEKSLELPTELEDAEYLPGKNEPEYFKTLKDNLDQANNVIAKTEALHNLRKYYISKQEYNIAIECVKEFESMALIQGCGLMYDLKNAHFVLDIARLYEKMDRYDEALQHYHDGLACATKCNNKELQSDCCAGLGYIFLSRGENDKAKELFTQAIECCEYIFDRLNQDKHQIVIVDKYVELYRAMTSLHLRDGEIEEALLFAERCRARALRQRLFITYGIKQEDNDKDQQLQYSDLIVSTSTYSILFYFYFSHDMMSVNLIDRGQILPCPVEPFVLNQNSLLINESFKEMQVRQAVKCENRSLDATSVCHEDRTLSLPSSTLHRNENVRGEPSENTDESAMSEPQKTSDATCASSALEELYKVLIGKVDTQNEVVIIPEGELYSVPFAALRDPDTRRYLSETKRIRLAPSLTTLKMLQECPVDFQSHTGALIIGDPSVGKVMLDGKKVEPDTLEGARKEAVDIARILRVSPLIGPLATKPEVLKRLQQGVSVIHIAAHGDAKKASIALAPSPEIREATIPDEEDYLLTMADVQKAQVRAQLVVLSCCHSGRGEIRAEGVVGMCRAFLASGARAVVASLWAIDDQATLEFMKYFFTYLKEGKSASTSLQLTTDDMRKSKCFSEPKYWAPFFLMGDDVTIKIN